MKQRRRMSPWWRRVFSMARTEQGDEEVNCAARLNKWDVVEI
jgi:hypothetical protein